MATCGNSMETGGSDGSEEYFVLADPRKLIPNAFEKQNRARPPVKARPAIAIIKMMMNEGSSDFRAENIPLKIKNSEINPLKGGKPQMAIAAIRNKIAVQGIFFTSPPS